MDHITTGEDRKWRPHKLFEQSVSRVFSSYSQNTAFFLIFPRPWPTVPVVCMACDNHINLCCLSLSLPTFFSPSALPLLSLTLWKPKELVRAQLTLLLFLHHLLLTSVNVLCFVPLLIRIHEHTRVVCLCVSGVLILFIVQFTLINL